MLFWFVFTCLFGPTKPPTLQRSGTRIRPAPLYSTIWHSQNVEEQLIDTVSSRTGHRGVRGSKGVIRPQSHKMKQVFRTFSLLFKKGKSGCWGLAIPGNKSKTVSSFRGNFLFLSRNLAARIQGGRQTNDLNQPFGKTQWGHYTRWDLEMGVGWFLILKDTLVLLRFVFVWGDFVCLFVFGLGIQNRKPDHLRL